MNIKELNLLNIMSNYDLTNKLKQLNNLILIIFMFIYLQMNNNNKLNAAAAASSSSTTTKSSSSSSSSSNSLTNDEYVDICDNCEFYLGGLFPVHAPRSRNNNNDNKQQLQLQIQQHHFQQQQQQLHQQQYNNNNMFIQTTTANINSNNNLLLIDGFRKSTCGEIKKERGIQRLEAMLYAIDLINNSTTLLPNIKLGAKIYDTCDRDTIALEKCMNFISDHFLLNNDNIINDFVCESPYTGISSSITPKKKIDVISKRKVVGVIGAASSSVSVQVANLLRLFQIPQISYASTSPELSNRERFPYFSRVLPSDTLQAEAMANLVKELKWNYVATLSEEGNLAGIDAFMSNAKNEKICISGSYTLSQTASEDDVNRIVLEMFKQKNSRAVVMFLQDHNIKKLLTTVNNLNLSDHFLFVASDSWGTKKESIDSNDLVAEGAITFAPKSFIIKGFNEYFKRLSPKTNKRNPWFKEFWEGQFDCVMSDSTKNQSKFLNKRLCTGDEPLDVAQDGFIHYVIDSVFAMAHAIEYIIDTHCKNYSQNDILKCEHLSPIKGTELLKAIRNVEFDSITGRRVKFLKDKNNLGDGITPFEVFQYQKNENGKYDYQKIAEWDSETDKLYFETAKLRWRGGTTELPKSICMEDCEPGEVKQGDTCCWVCVKCDETEYTNENKTKCVKCALGYGPNDNKTDCVKLPIEYMNFNSAFTIVPIILSSIGIVFTCYCIAIFIRYNETPIIKASGRELCYVLLAGIMSCYILTFPLVTKPTIGSCFILQVGVSLSLTVCLSALFTKTNRLSRIFNNSIKKVKQASYVSPRSQLVICSSIISVQVLGVLIWLVISPPGLSYDYEDPKRVVLQCTTPNTHLAISLIYNIILVILCTTYAVKTRKIPENFNEARFIGFTMYSICIIWAAFIPIYFGHTATSGKSYKNNYKVQLTTFAICLNLSASVILACLFLPKMKVVVLKPNKNVRLKTGNVVKAIYANTINTTKASTESISIKQMVSVATVNSTSKTLIIGDKNKNNNKRKTFGKIAFLWSNNKNENNNNIIIANKNNLKLLANSIANEKTHLNTDFKKNGNGITNDINNKTLEIEKSMEKMITDNFEELNSNKTSSNLELNFLKNDLSHPANAYQEANLIIQNKHTSIDDQEKYEQEKQIELNEIKNDDIFENKNINDDHTANEDIEANLGRKGLNDLPNGDPFVNNDAIEYDLEDSNTILFSSTNNLNELYTMRITFV